MFKQIKIICGVYATRIFVCNSVNMWYQLCTQKSNKYSLSINKLNKRYSSAVFFYIGNVLVFNPTSIFKVCFVKVINVFKCKLSFWYFKKLKGSNGIMSLKDHDYVNCWTFHEYLYCWKVHEYLICLTPLIAF